MGFSHHSKHSEKHFMRRNNSEFTKISSTFQLSIESNPELFWFWFCLLSEFVSTDLAHHTVPTVDICYVKVEDALKLPELLRCLNSLAGSIRYPLSNIGRAKNGNVTSVQKVNVDHSTNDSSCKKDEDKSYSVERVAGRLDLEKEINIDGETQGRQGEACLKPVRLKNLRVLVFVNTTKAAEEAYNFLNGTAEQGESDSVL